MTKAPKHIGQRRWKQMLQKKHPLIAMPDGKVVFFQGVPKTANQSIYTAFGKKLQAHLPIFHRNRWKHYCECDEVMFVRRHPIERAISNYRWFATIHLDPGRRRRTENAALNLWARNVSLNDFYRGMDFEWAARFTPHFQPATWFLKESKDGDYVQAVYLRFEHLAEDFAVYCRSHGYDDPPELPHINAAPEEVKRDRRLDPDVEKKLRDYYAEDYKMLGYE